MLVELLLAGEGHGVFLVRVGKVEGGVGCFGRRGVREKKNSDENQMEKKAF